MSDLPNNITHLHTAATTLGAQRPMHLHRAPRSDDSRGGGKPRFVAKGHDAQLQDAQSQGLAVRMRLCNAPDPVEGVITRRDRYTITLRHAAGADTGLEEIFYKHAIESVLIKPRAA